MVFFLTNTQLYTSKDVNWWTGVVWIIVMFLSAVWTLILMAPIHCRGSIGEQVMQNFSILIYILDGLRVNKFPAKLLFWWAILLIIKTCLLIFPQAPLVICKENTKGDLPDSSTSTHLGDSPNDEDAKQKLDVETSARNIFNNSNAGPFSEMFQIHIFDFLISWLSVIFFKEFCLEFHWHLTIRCSNTFCVILNNISFVLTFKN